MPTQPAAIMLTADQCASAWATLHRRVSTSKPAAPLPAQMRPVLRRPPPGATDVLTKLAPWFPGGFPPSRADFAAPAQPLDRGHMGAPLCEPALRSGGRLAVFRHRLAEANQYVRVRSILLLGRLLTDMNSSKGVVRWRETSSKGAVRWRETSSWRRPTSMGRRASPAAQHRHRRRRENPPAGHDLSEARLPPARLLC